MPPFRRWNNVVKKGAFNERLPEGMETVFKRLGQLDFAKLAEDGFLDIARGADGEPVAISIYERD